MQKPATAVQQPDAQDLPQDAATLYPEDDGFFGRRAKARRAKLLAGVAGTLRQALAPGETIRYAARGVRYHFFEQMFGGAAVAQYHNMMALVLTERRLLLLQVDRRGRTADIKNEIPLASLRAAVPGGLYGFRLRLADGTSLAISQLRRPDRKRFAALIPSSEGPTETAPSIVPLCPSCLRAVPGRVGTVLVCPQPDCRIPFRDPGKAARLSAFVPGLGDLYLRHHFFGSMEFLGSMAMLGVALALALGAVGGDGASLAGAGVVLVLFIGVPRLIDWRLTLHMGRKGLVPLALVPAPGAQARNLPSFPRWSPLLFVAGLAVAGGIVAVLSQDLRHDSAVREASALAGQGRFDDAVARWNALESAGGVTAGRRVKFALALLDAGDLEDADAMREKFQGEKVEQQLADRWNAATAREEAALEDYREGVQALVRGEDASARIDRALAYFRHVSRPHLPQSPGEVHAHLAMGALAEPLSLPDLASAAHWLEGVAGAPAAEIALVRAAYDSARGERDPARQALARLDDGALSSRFRLLALEARARVADGDAERAAVRKAAETFPRANESEDTGKRLDALLERLR